jgi:hypothetical protein
MVFDRTPASDRSSAVTEPQLMAEIRTREMASTKTTAKLRSNGFQRTGLCGSSDHPRRAETAERATCGTKSPPRPPPQPVPRPLRLVCGGNHGDGTHWCPSGGGGSLVAMARPPALPSLVALFRAVPKPPRSARQSAKPHGRAK